MTSDFASLSHSQSFELYTTPPKRQSPFACYVWWLLHRLWDQSLMVLSASDSPAFALLRTPAHRHNPRHLPVLHSYSLRAKILTCSTKSFIDTRPNWLTDSDWFSLFLGLASFRQFLLPWFYTTFCVRISWLVGFWAAKPMYRIQDSKQSISKCKDKGRDCTKIRKSQFLNGSVSWFMCHRQTTEYKCGLL